MKVTHPTTNNKQQQTTTNNNKQHTTMASKVFATKVINGFNDAIRDTLSDALKRMMEADTASDCREILEKMISDVKTNKKVDKVKKPRYSGYHIFMREYRAVVKAEQPDLSPQELTSVVAKSWKDVSEDKKAEYNNRAAKLKAEASESSASDSDSSQSDNSSNEKTKSVTKKVAADSKPSKKTKKVPDDSKPSKKTKKVPDSKTKKTKVASDDESNKKTSFADEIEVEIDSDEDI